MTISPKAGFAGAAQYQTAQPSAKNAALRERLRKARESSGCQAQQIRYLIANFTDDELREFDARRQSSCEICIKHLDPGASHQATYHVCKDGPSRKVCNECLSKLGNLCPYCQEKPQPAVVKQRCRECGSEEVTRLAQSSELQCKACGYSQCTECSLAAHGATPCRYAVEDAYLKLKRVFSSVTLDPTVHSQFCTHCDKVLSKALKCGHYHCSDCHVTFCMFCRLPWSESHMNPFSEDACCLFRIGAKKQEAGLSSGGTQLGRL